MKTFKGGVLIFLLAVSAVKAQSLTDGIKAIDYENYASARNIFKKLIAQQPSEGKNYYYLGQAYDNLGKRDSARMAYDAGTKADPKSFYNFIGMGRTYLDDNNVQKATEFFDKAKGLSSSKDPLYYTLVADAYVNSEHPNKQEGINQLNKAIGYNDKVAEVYWQLGQAYESLNRGGEAVSAYERAAELNPSYAKAHTRIGVIWRLARNYNQSLASLEKALQIDPNFPPAYRQLAELYYNTAQYDKAKTAFEKYRDLADKDDNTQYQYAQYLFLSKDYKGAISILDELRKRINTPVSWRLSAYSNYELQNYDIGKNQLDTFFRKTDTSKILSLDYEYYGKLLGKTGNDSLAMLNLKKAISMDTSKYALYNEIGNILLQSKQYHEAAVAYQSKISASPKDATLQDFFNVGKSYYLSKEFPLSDTAFVGMTKLNKAWPIGYVWQARVMTNLDNPDSTKGLAAPFYHMTIAKTMQLPDTSKYNKELQEAYNYLAQINAVKENYGVSLYYYQNYLKYNPSDSSDAAKNIEIIKKQIKTATSSSSLPIGKNGDSTAIEVTVNGSSLDFSFNPGAPGIVVNNEGYLKLFSSAPESGAVSKSISAKIGDHSAKKIVVTVDASQLQPLVIGAWALNQFNIVPDYKAKILMLR
ncbi:MAG: tetratricopeptide repeat protein [Chitinophagales bacterium]|nr:tetratricopeptide repeat protein [Chitinophagales bacterium]